MGEGRAGYAGSPLQKALVCLVSTTREEARLDSAKVFILNEYRAQQSAGNRDLTQAIVYSKTAADAAAETGDDWGFCRMMFNIANYQYELGLLEESVATSRTLVNLPGIRQYPDFESRANVLLSRALQDKGDMEEALSVALEASAYASQDASVDVRLSAQHGLVSALAEEGDLEAAWDEAVVLSTMVAPDASARVRGMAHWTVGNVGFMTGRNREGLDHHRKAAQALTSINDVTLWGLFNKASAHVRLVAGIVENETLECIERAEVALGVTGAGESDLHELKLTRARWEVDSGNPNEAERLLRRTVEEVRESYPFLEAIALELLARSLESLGQPTEALDAAQRSEHLFTMLRASVRADDARALVDRLLKQIA